jgi:hypothetical protein
MRSSRPKGCSEAEQTAELPGSFEWKGPGGIYPNDSDTIQATNLAGRDINIPFAFKLLVHLFFYINLRASANSPTALMNPFPASLDAEPTNVARNIDPGKMVNDKLKEVKSSAPDGPPKMTEIVEDVKDKIEDIVKVEINWRRDVGTVAVDSILAPLMSKLVPTPMPTLVPKTDDWTNDGYKAHERSIDKIPIIFFWPWLVYFWVVTGSVMFITCLIFFSYLLYFYVKHKDWFKLIFQGNFKDLVKKQIDSLKDDILKELGGKMDEIRNKIDVFFDDFKKTIGEVPDKLKKELPDMVAKIVKKWVMDTLKDPFEKVPLLKGIKWAIDKRDLDEISSSPSYISVAIPPFQPTALSSRAEEDTTIIRDVSEDPVNIIRHLHDLSTTITTCTRTTTSTIRVYPRSSTSLPSPDTNMQTATTNASMVILDTSPIPTGTLVINSGLLDFSMSATSPALPSNTSFTGAAAQLYVLPFFALFARSHKHKHHDQNRPISQSRKRTSHSYWQAYHHIRSSAIPLCYTIQDRTDELSSFTVKKLSCDTFAGPYPTSNASLGHCEAKSLYEMLYTAGSEYCEESRHLATDKCLVLQARGVQMRDQFCQIVEGFEKREGEWEASECESGDNSEGISSSEPVMESKSSKPLSTEVSMSTEGEETPISSLLLSKQVGSESSSAPLSLTTASNPPSITAPPLIPSSSDAKTPTGSSGVYSPPPYVTTTCSESVKELTLVATPPVYTPSFFSSFPPRPASIHYFGFTNPIVNYPWGVPCGYTKGTEGMIVPAAEQTGELTWYDPADGITACGDSISPGEAIVAINWQIFDVGRPVSWEKNGAPLCGRTLEAWCFDGQGEKRSGLFVVKDRCDGCRPRDIDVEQGAFPFCTPTEAGRVPVTWKWAGEITTQIGRV